MARRGMLLRPPPLRDVVRRLRVVLIAVGPLLSSKTPMTSTNSAHGLLPPPTTPVTTSTEETQQ